MTSPASSIIENLRETLLTLDAKRRALESEGEAIISELTTAPPEQPSGVRPMGIDTPLVDGDGYPRADIDVYRARTLRGRLAVIKTDRKDLMKRTEELLVQLAAMQNPNKAEEEVKEQAARAAPKPKPRMDPVTGKWVVPNWDGTVAGIPDGDKRRFNDLEGERMVPSTAAAAAATDGNASSSTPEDDDDDDDDTDHLLPFARVDAVANESPAAAAGLQEGDLIVKFGSGIDHTNHDQLSAIAELVPRAAAHQETIRLVVRRRQQQGAGEGEQQTVSLYLSPRPWNGRGMLGCHIVPYSA